MRRASSEGLDVSPGSCIVVGAAQSSEQTAMSQSSQTLMRNSGLHDAVRDLHVALDASDLPMLGETGLGGPNEEL
ncbi:hypothetical protein V6N11_017653 [Hibiscus sabdariffa]|uniref:Uncharacterized protein n=1 Tax=Hibiscus sabdariffa TaxID=183260 RepID=A0ABR2TYS9_9ROSI